MDIERLKDLLPFYAAGTLEPDEKAELDEALKTSAELRNELQFWLRVKSVVTSHAAYESAGHMSSQQIVDRAAGRLTGDALLAADRHLQSCPECSQDFARVQDTLEALSKQKAVYPDRPNNRVRSLQLRYVLPALTGVVIIAVIIVLQTRQKHQTAPQVTSVPSSSGHIGDTSATVSKQKQPPLSLLLVYEPVTRGLAARQLHNLVIRQTDQKINITILVPRTVENGSYQVTLTQPGGKLRLQELVVPSGRGAMYDTLAIDLGEEAFRITGKYAFAVQEKLPASAIKQGSSPESYFVPFMVTRPQ